MALVIRRGLYGATLAALGACGLRKSADKRSSPKQLAGVPLHAAEDAGAVAEQWMVSFGAKAVDATMEAFCAQSGQCVSKGHPDAGGIAFAVVKGTVQALESSIAAQPAEVEFVEQDAVAEDFETDLEAPSASASWGLNAVGVPTASGKGRGVNVYVLDSGIRVTHQDFGGRAIPFYDATFSPPKVCDASAVTCAQDRRGHGSHVAGSVGGTTFGVAPESTLFAMQRGNTLAEGYACIDWLVQNHQRPAVLQMSWGRAYDSEVAKAAVDAAVAASITTVVASGNSNENACRWTFARIPAAIAVSSTDSTSSRSSFSNFGSCIDILAPGSDIVSADFLSDDGSSVMSGTSMAAPHVSGGAALLLETNPEASPEQVLASLIANSWKNGIADAKADNYFLNVGLARAPAPPTTPPPTPAPTPGACWSGCQESSCAYYPGYCGGCSFCQN